MLRIKIESFINNLAIDRNNNDIAKLLIKNKATNLNLIGNDGQTALMKGTTRPNNLIIYFE